MTFPVAWSADVCAEADVVLTEIKSRIVDDQYNGEYWASYCYREATERVAARRT